MTIHHPVARETLVRRVQLAAAGTPHRINPTASGFDLTVYAPDGSPPASRGTDRPKVVHHVHVDELAGTVSVTDGGTDRDGRQEPVAFGLSWNAKRGRRKSLRLTLGPSGVRARSFDREVGRRIVVEAATALGWRTS